MQIRTIDKTAKILKVDIPLTRGMGKSRIKKRSSFNEYGIPVPTKTESFSGDCYAEWQIGYDLPIADKAKLSLTSTSKETFTNYKDKKKALYELSEYIYYFYKWGIVKKAELEKIQIFLKSLKNTDFIDNPANFAVTRTSPAAKTVCGMAFEYTQVQYPLLIHQFNPDMLTEIKITEKQYAIGVQPMLYLCFSIAELTASSPLIGRTARAKETADFIINQANIGIFLEMIKIFGMLSRAHNHDVQAIISKILE